MKNCRETADKVEQLFAVLDSDIDNLRKTLLRLDQMRSAVIKRNDAELAKILDEIRSETQSQQTQQLQKMLLMKELAEIFDCNCQDLTLTKLQRFLPDGQGELLAQKREQLRILAGRLKKEYSATVFLLVECARFNRLMLNIIFNKQKADVIAYDAAGAAKRQSQPAFVNVKL